LRDTQSSRTRFPQQIKPFNLLPLIQTYIAQGRRSSTDSKTLQRRLSLSRQPPRSRSSPSSETASGRAGSPGELDPLPEHPLGVDRTSVFLARVVIPVGAANPPARAGAAERFSVGSSECAAADDQDTRREEFALSFFTDATK